ncbi:MAG: hypothetical protein JNK05_35705 [Myxococcales bacterium]|nr:hypothetical protein [Myxococcales bacterium]
MTRVGDSAVGYSIESSRSLATTVVVRAWGFWKSAVAERFAEDVLSAVTKSAPFTVLFDLTELKPQGYDGEKAFDAAIAAVSALSSFRCAAIVTTNALSKLQLNRLVRAQKQTRWVFVDSLADAERALAAASRS